MPNWTKEQKEAIEKEGTNIIVSAGAGSGKTAVLTERVIRKLKQGVNINELLILTFTENAAKEMKERIRKSIIKENLTSQLNLIDSSYITTFDSYALSIVKKYYYLLNINPDISIIDSNIIKLKKEEFLDEIFNGLYEEENSDFYKLLNDFTNKNDKVIRNNIIKIYDKLITTLNYEDLLSDYFNIYFTNDFINKKVEEFNNKLLKKIELIKNLLDILSSYVDYSYMEKTNNLIDNLLKSRSYNEIIKNIDIKLPNLRNCEKEAKIYKKEINDILDEIKNICIYEDEKSIYSSIKLTKDYIKVIIEILFKLDKKIKEYKKSINSYEFLDIELLAIKVFKENQDVANTVKYSLNEIMIDEYQDTNDIGDTFISYISNNNVYMVGDVKQSIYRFRNANPNIFKEKYDKYSNNIDGYKIDLNKNFRSREEVLDGINKIFNRIMSLDIGGADYINQHQMIFGNNEYNTSGKTKQNNNIEIYEYQYDKHSNFKKEEYEIFIIANDIKNKVESGYLIFDNENKKFKKATFNDFVILINKSKNFDLYRKIFEYLNIPLSVFKEENLKDSILLKLINNLLLLTIKIKEKNYNEEYKHALVSILRSFIFEYSDEEILNIIDNNLNIDLLKKLNALDLSNVTSYELINYFIYEFKIYEKIYKIGDIDSNLVALEYILSKAKELQKLGYTLIDFSNYLTNTFQTDLDIKFNVNKESNNSVKIMTIHKSKGLEYSICYFPELHNYFNKSDLNELFLFDKKYGLITPFYDNGKCDTIYKYLLKEEYNKEEISERLRLFYVALTRAKEKMILVTDLSNELIEYRNDGLISDELRLKYKSFNDIILSLKDDLKIYTKKVEVELTKDYENIKKFNINIDSNNDKLSVVEHLKDETLLKEKTFSKSIVKLNTKEEKDNMKFGTYIHSLLETVDLKEKNIDYIKEEYRNKIKNFLNKDIFKNIKDAKIFKEYEFIFEHNKTIYHGIIDLMIEYNKYIDIIDYKLKSIEDEAYINQLNGYKYYIENITNKEVNLYLYSIINDELKKI